MKKRFIAVSALVCALQFLCGIAGAAPIAREFVPLKAPVRQISPRPSPLAQVSTPILVGTGISDITGPIAEVTMMGYANIGQSASGLHTRLYARAFVFANPDSDQRVVMVTAELGQLFSSVKQGVVRRLQQIFKGPKYNDSNVMLCATHTHAGPGGYSHHDLFNITSGGFVKQNYEAIVEGITKAIVQADGNVGPATIGMASNMMAEKTASVNRSPDAYNKNQDLKGLPNVNLQMLLLRVDRPTTGPAGVIAWFSVHNTSLTKNNLLIGSDHKGYAAYLFEKQQGTIAPFQQPGKFVAAFPNGDEGDVSPNVLPDFKRPGKDEYEAVKILGELEFRNANKLFTNVAKKAVTGPVEYRHMFVRMSEYQVPNSEFTNGAGGKKLCKAAYGMSFGGGAEDGPSEMFDLHEGMVYDQQTAAGWSRVRSIVSGSSVIPSSLRSALKKSADVFDDPCQLPKPILIPTGSWEWTPDILPFQLVRIGPLAIAAVPAELTTQSGRRLRKVIEDALRTSGVTDVVITGLANEYSGYVSTREEYDLQHYEGASTVYGRLTLDAYTQIFKQLADAMAAKQAVPVGPTPPDLGNKQTELQTGVIFDGSGAEKFGQVLQQPFAAIDRNGALNVQAIFRAGHPKNDLKTNDTYLLIERKNGSTWEAVAWDSMPETRLTWKHEETSVCIACSTATVRWEVPRDAMQGTYRIRHFGAWKNGSNGAITKYEGVTNSFQPASLTSPVTPCGGRGERACCATELPDARKSPCEAGLNEAPACVGPNCTCGGYNPLRSSKSKTNCVPTTACGGKGERACCIKERSGGIGGTPCKPGLQEGPPCNGVSCICGGDNPGGSSKSIGLCVAVTPCGGAGQRACCVTERVPSCNQGLREEGKCVGPDCTCGGPNPTGILKSLGLCAAPPQITPCGAVGQRACCVTERIPSCNQGLQEVGNCTGSNCTCGGANPGSVLKSKGLCAAPPPPQITACGAAGQRACCVTERNSACNQGLREQGNCSGPGCTCGGNNPGSLLKSIGLCAAIPAPPAITPCGGEGQRACCVIERGLLDPGCRKGLRETPGCTGNCTCGGSNPGGAIKSSGKCVK